MLLCGVVRMWSGTLLHLPYKSTQVHPTSVVRHRCNLPIKRPKTCCLAHFQLSIRFSELSTGFQSKLRVSESFGEPDTAITAITAITSCVALRSPFQSSRGFPPGVCHVGPVAAQIAQRFQQYLQSSRYLQMQPWTVSKGHSLEV